MNVDFATDADISLMLSKMISHAFNVLKIFHGLLTENLMLCSIIFHDSKNY